MSTETQELLNLFVSLSSNDSEIIQNASLKLINLSTKSNYSLNLLWIIINENIENIYRFSAGIQLKNLIDKNWQRGLIFTQNDKEIIKIQILNCANLNSFKNGNFYNILAEIIAKISRVDWDKKWPNLFIDLFNNDNWFIIYRVCQAQVTRRLSQGILLFKDIAMAMSGEILLKFTNFVKNFNDKNIKNNTLIELMLYNASYQLKIINLFILNTHLLISDNEFFCKIINNFSLLICSYFPSFIENFNESNLTNNSRIKNIFYRFLKMMIWILLSYQNKSPNKFIYISNEIEQFGLKIVFNSNYIIKSDKLSLLIFNLMLNYLKFSEKNRSKSSIFDIQIIDYIRTRYFICNEEEIENIENDPTVILECKKDKDLSLILYNVDEVIENLMVELVKGSSTKNLNEIMEKVLIFQNNIDLLNIAEVEAFIHFIGIVIQSSFYANSPNAKKYGLLLHCPTIIDRVINSVVNKKAPYLSESWKNYLCKRCIWLYGKWAVDDINVNLISTERLACASQWCFKAAHSQLGVIVKMEACLYIEHVVEALEKLPSNFTDSDIMLNIFFNPSITTIVSVLDMSSSSDTHTRLIDILIKLFHGTNMWNNIDLVKTAANSIYNLWITINRPSRDTIILRDRLLECLSTIVSACDPTVLQPILPTLSSFITDSLSLIVTKGNNKVDNCLVLLDNTLQLWHDIVYNTEVLFEELDNIYSLIICPNELSISLDKDQTTLILEVIQAYFLLKVLGSFSKESFNSLTLTSWNNIINQHWDPKQEENLCAMRIQLFDLWLLGFQQAFKESLTSLFEMNIYSQFLCDRVKELFLTTHCEPSDDMYHSIINGVLTILARLCLFDRPLLKRILDYLSSNEVENQQFMVGLLDRWLLRIDNQASTSVQQLFVLASIHWLSLCCEYYPELLSNKFNDIINSCIQICTNVPTNNMEQQTTIAKSILVPAERHLNLAYLAWNPLNDCSRIRDSVTTFMERLNNSLGVDKFQEMFATLDTVVQYQFIEYFHR